MLCLNLIFPLKFALPTQSLASLWNPELWFRELTPKGGAIPWGQFYPSFPAATLLSHPAPWITPAFPMPPAGVNCMWPLPYFISTFPMSAQGQVDILRESSSDTWDKQNVYSIHVSWSWYGNLSVSGNHICIPALGQTFPAPNQTALGAWPPLPTARPGSREQQFGFKWEEGHYGMNLSCNWINFASQRPSLGCSAAWNSGSRCSRCFSSAFICSEQAMLTSQSFFLLSK